MPDGADGASPEANRSASSPAIQCALARYAHAYSSALAARKERGQTKSRLFPGEEISHRVVAHLDGVSGGGDRDGSKGKVERWSLTGIGGSCS